MEDIWSAKRITPAYLTNYDALSCRIRSEVFLAFISVYNGAAPLVDEVDPVLFKLSPGLVPLGLERESFWLLLHFGSIYFLPCYCLKDLFWPKIPIFLGSILKLHSCSCFTESCSCPCTFFEDQLEVRNIVIEAKFVDFLPLFHHVYVDSIGLMHEVRLMESVYYWPFVLLKYELSRFEFSLLNQLEGNEIYR